MKKYFLIATLSAAVIEISAQVANDTIPATPIDSVMPAGQTQPAAQTASVVQKKYGYLSYNALLRAMPEYAETQRHMADLRVKYEAEAQYNERAFKRMFGEFLEGQKDFPKNILLKRQRDLQAELEKGVAFRHEADSLLQRAEQNMLVPVRQRLEQAIRLVGEERGYEYVLNIDNNTYPYIHPSVAEDITEWVKEKLAKQE